MVVQWLKELAAFSEDPGSSPSTLMAAHNHLQLHLLVLQALFWPPGHYIQGLCVCHISLQRPSAHLSQPFHLVGCNTETGADTGQQQHCVQGGTAYRHSRPCLQHRVQEVQPTGTGITVCSTMYREVHPTGTVGPVCPHIHTYGYWSNFRVLNDHSEIRSVN